LKLPEAFHTKVLSCFVHDPKFFARVERYVRQEDFDSLQDKFLFSLIKRSYHKYHTQPTRDYMIEEVSTYLRSKPYLENERSVWVHKLHYVLTRHPDESYIKEKFEDLLRRSILNRTIKKTIEALDTAPWEQLKKDLLRALSVATPDGYEGVRVFNVRVFKNVSERIRERLCSGEMRVPTMIKPLDKIIGGGLSPGELGVIMALPGVGKSLCLVNIGFGCVLQKKKVVYYSLEMSSRKIVGRFDALISGVAHERLRESGEEVKKKVEELARDVGDTLIVKHFPTKRAGVDSLAVHLDHLDRIGFRAEVILVDYISLLRSNGRFGSMYEEVGSICRDLRGLAGERNLVLWTASQANRQAVDADLVTPKHMAESFRVFADADVVVSLTQKPLERKIGRMRLTALKVRDRKGGWTETIETDYARMRFCKNEFAI